MKLNKRSERLGNSSKCKNKMNLVGQTCLTPSCLRRGWGWGGGGGSQDVKERGKLYVTQHCPLQNDYMEMGSDESHFNVSLT